MATMIRINDLLSVELKQEVVVVHHVLGHTYSCNWPEGVPRNNDELVRNWGDFVLRRLKAFNKVQRNLEDLAQDVWMRLIAAQILEKFVAGAAVRFPEKISGLEAMRFLGLSWAQWSKIVRPDTTGTRWAPEPADPTASPTEPETEFLMSHVRILDELIPQHRRRCPRLRPTLTARGWKAYLVQAIHNHYANFCRTRNRKYRDQLLSPDSVVVARRGSEGYHLGGTMEDGGGAWEHNIMDSNLGAEEMYGLVTVKRQLEEALEARGMGFDQVLAMESFQTDDGRSGQRPAAEARVGLEILDLMMDGHDVQSACESQARSDLRAKFRARRAVA